MHHETCEALANAWGLQESVQPGGAAQRSPASVSHCCQSCHTPTVTRGATYPALAHASHYPTPALQCCQKSEGMFSWLPPKRKNEGWGRKRNKKERWVDRWMDGREENVSTVQLLAWPLLLPWQYKESVRHCYFFFLIQQKLVEHLLLHPGPCSYPSGACC